MMRKKQNKNIDSQMKKDYRLFCLEYFMLHVVTTFTVMLLLE